MLLGEFIPTSNCPHCEKKNSSVVSFLSVLLSITLGLITPPPDRLMHHLILVIFSICRYKQTINKSLFHYCFHYPSICWWAAGPFWLLRKTTPTFQLAKLQGLVIRWNFLKLPVFIHIASSKAFVLKSLAHKGCKWHEMPRPSSHFPDEWNMRNDPKNTEQYTNKWAMPVTHL